MPDNQERERALAVYASEIRSYHTFFWLAFLAAGILHLLVLMPFLQARASLPRVEVALERAVHEEAAIVSAQRALAATSDALVRFRRQFESGPLELHAAIAEIVERGGEAAVVEEAVRRRIGVHSEALTLALDSALEPLAQARTHLPTVEGVLRTARNGVARSVLELNPALRSAFAADPESWQRWQAPGASYGLASPDLEKVARGIEEGLRGLKLQLAAAGADARDRLRAARERVERVGAGEAAMKARLDAVKAQLDWLPAQPAEVARFFPVVLGGLALTVLLRLRRLLDMRRAIGVSEANPAASSWLVGTPSHAGGWWALALALLPLVGAIHASVMVMADPGVFTTPLGDQDLSLMVGFGATYAVLIAASIAQIPSATRGLVTGQRSASRR